MDKITYISYYTENTPYKEVMESYLLPSLKLFNLNYDIEGIKNKGSWQANTHYKAMFCKQMLLKHKQPVVFLDADAIIKQNPILFETLDNYDIAYHILNWANFWHRQTDNPRRDVLNGTLFLNYNEKILEFLDKWIEQNNKNLQWEQKNMEQVIKDKVIELNIYNLPPEYCAIIGMDNKTIADWYVKEEPVIVHYQKSRKLKYQIRRTR